MLNPVKIIIALILLFLQLFVQSCKTPAIIATQTINKADEYNNQNNYSEAIHYYNKYIGIAPGLGVYRNLSMEADVYRKLAYAYSARSVYDSSLYCLQKALVIDSLPGSDALDIIEDYRRLGITFGYKGDFINSKKFLNKSLQLNAGMDKSLKEIRRYSIGDTYLSLAQVNFVIGNFSEAEEDVARAISIYNKIDNDYLGLLESYLLLGKIRIERGETESGLRLIEKSITIAENNNLNTARHYLAIGSAYLMESKYEEALKNRLEALKKAEESRIIPQIIWMNVKVGDVFTYLGDEKKAQDYYETALQSTSGPEEDVMAASPSLQMRLGDVQQASDLYIRSGSLMGAALADLRLGEINEKNNNTKQAEYYFSKSDSIFRIIGSDAGQAYAKLGLCRIFVNKNMLGNARILIGQIIALSNNPEIEWQLLFEKGRIFEKQNDVYAAFSEYCKSIDVIEKIRGNLNIEEFRSAYMKNKIHVYEKLIMLLLENSEDDVFKNLKQSPAETAFYYSERARARSFLDILGNNKICAKQSSDTTLLNKELSLRLQIQKIVKEIETVNQGGARAAELQKYLGSLNQEYTKTLDLIKLSNNDYNSLVTVEPAKLSEIQELIAGKNALIEYWLGAEKTVIWVITNKSIKVKIINTGADKIEKSVIGCRSMIMRGSGDGYISPLAELYKTLILPVEPDINGYESLFIVPHRSLHFLPFQALIDSGSSYLIEKFNVSYAPSSSVLIYCSLKRPDVPDNFLGMALGDMVVGRFPPLPGTKAELKQIIQLYPGATARYEKESTETYFKSEAGNHNIIHLATHGFLDSDHPLNSYLLMPFDEKNDGQLTVNEIFDLKLKSKLVVLSACETGLGHLSTGDELTGLSRAFIYAGTPAIIVSLWPVDDASTALLMTRLHQYSTAGYRLQDAITLGQRDLINNNLRSTVDRGNISIVWDQGLQYEIESGNLSKGKSPFFWAPFILIGYGGQ